MFVQTSRRDRRSIRMIWTLAPFLPAPLNIRAYASHMLLLSLGKKERKKQKVKRPAFPPLSRRPEQGLHGQERSERAHHFTRSSPIPSWLLLSPTSGSQRLYPTPTNLGAAATSDAWRTRHAHGPVRHRQVSSGTARFSGPGISIIIVLSGAGLIMVMMWGV